MFLGRAGGCTRAPQSVRRIQQEGGRSNMPLVSSDRGTAVLPLVSEVGVVVLPPGPLRELRRKGFVDIRFQEPCTQHMRPWNGKRSNLSIVELARRLICSCG